MIKTPGSVHCLIHFDFSVKREWHAQQVNCARSHQVGVRRSISLRTMRDKIGSTEYRASLRLAPRADFPDNADHITARTASYMFDKYGIFTATLDNEQVWRQVSGDTELARWNKAAARHTVHISRGLLGSYNLQIKDNSGMFKVRRVR